MTQKTDYVHGEIIDAEFVSEPRVAKLEERSDVEQIAIELAGVPRKIVGEVIERVRRRFPERSEAIKRVAAGVDDTLVKLADIERGAPLSRNGGPR